MDSTGTDADRGLERFRSYLLLLARGCLDPLVQAKVGASDVVQQMLLEAYRDLAQWRGRTAGEQAAWLRQILARNLANVVRDLRGDKRDAGREWRLQTALDESASRLETWLAAEHSSPSQQAEGHERALRLADALATLPENQREAVILRHWHGYSLVEIGERLSCTTAAVTGHLHRGLRNLRQQLHDLELVPTVTGWCPLRPLEATSLPCLEQTRQLPNWGSGTPPVPGQPTVMSDPAQSPTTNRMTGGQTTARH
jgi:RNA polymerase sigma-70 factor (ECF subfamily)